jgi:hypothetical protein
MTGISICLTCQHFYDYQKVGDEYLPTCAAFPRGIPERISMGIDTHRQPMTGDHGIQYRKDPTKQDWHGE